MLQRLPISCPGVVIVQHMPEFFTNTFAKRLNELCDLEVWEAKDGDEVKPGQAVVAPGSITCCCDAAGGGLTFRSSRVQRFPGIALRWMSSSSPLQKQQGSVRWM